MRLRSMASVLITMIFSLSLGMSTALWAAEEPDVSSIPSVAPVLEGSATAAPAAGATPAELSIAGFVLPQGTFMIVLLILFYFMLIRPQMKRAKAQQNLVNNLAVGDVVLSSGGLRAKIMALDATWLQVEIAAGVVVHLQRQAVVEKILL